MKKIPGLNLVELPHNREKALCCGGGTEVFYPQVAEIVSEKAAEEIKSISPDELIVSCPDCDLAFWQSTYLSNINFEHYIDILAKSMGIYHKNILKEFLLMDSVDSILKEAEENLISNGIPIDTAKQILGTYLTKLLDKIKKSGRKFV